MIFAHNAIPFFSHYVMRHSGQETDRREFGEVEDSPIGHTPSRLNLMIVEFLKQHARLAIYVTQKEFDAENSYPDVDEDVVFEQLAIQRVLRVLEEA
jgi:hypothetical protein